ncbi:MAG: hypothetical protein SGPRY_007084, partial [Prymnesium sp.]
ALRSSVHFDGSAIHLKGVSWFGLEGTGKVPDGLWVNSLDFYLDFLAENKFNALRLPFALDSVLTNPKPAREMMQAAPELWGLDYMSVIERVVDAAADRGILVLLDLHRLEAKRWPTDGLWYTPDISLQTLKQGWERMQDRFCMRWNVLGADILNEPHGARWKDWVVAATEVGDSILTKAEHSMPYFNAVNFPDNLPKVWDQHFGYLSEAGNTLVIGEWGGLFIQQDRKWQEALFKYILDRGLGFFYWSLNPNSEDTGGLLSDDWKLREHGKLNLIQAAPSSQLIPRLRTVPAFACLATPIAQHFKCANGVECILKQQVCDGAHDCQDFSDELECAGHQRACITVAGGDRGRPCAIPFFYNGFEYDGCTSVDAFDAWSVLGVGLCQHGYISSVSGRGGTLEQCQDTCRRAANCSIVSFTNIGGSYCSGYTTSCKTLPLNTVKADYITYQFETDGGPCQGSSIPLRTLATILALSTPSKSACSTSASSFSSSIAASAPITHT